MLRIRANGKKGVRPHSPNSTNSIATAIIIAAFIVLTTSAYSVQGACQESAGSSGSKSTTKQEQPPVAPMTGTTVSTVHNYGYRLLHSQQSSNRPRKKTRKRQVEIKPANYKQPGLEPGDLRQKAVAGGFPAFNKGAAFSPHPPFSSDVAPHNLRPVTIRRSPRGELLKDGREPRWETTLTSVPWMHHFRSRQTDWAQCRQWPSGGR